MLNTKIRYRCPVIDERDTFRIVRQTSLDVVIGNAEGDRYLVSPLNLVPIERIQ